MGRKLRKISFARVRMQNIYIFKNPRIHLVVMADLCARTQVSTELRELKDELNLWQTGNKKDTQQQHACSWHKE